ncbi:MAG: GntR family transcriptional regulator [Bacteroidales bacterium]|nr:GntR family transcriptional regulator [Bacteroidales bacterium]
MQFDNNKPIAIQIEEFCRMQITSGGWPSDSRIPSTKDLAMRLGVNPRTVMKAYDSLAEQGAIYQKRGLGYFVAPAAIPNVLQILRRKFMTETLPETARRILELKLDVKYVTDMLTHMVQSLDNKQEL